MPSAFPSQADSLLRFCLLGCRRGGEALVFCVFVVCFVACWFVCGFACFLRSLTASLWGCAGTGLGEQGPAHLWALAWRQLPCQPRAPSAAFLPRGSVSGCAVLCARPDVPPPEPRSLRSPLEKRLIP